MSTSFIMAGPAPPGEKKLQQSNARGIQTSTKMTHHSLISKHPTNPSMSDSLYLHIPIASKFPHNLADGVGLGIVAAMNSTHSHSHGHKPICIGSMKTLPRSSPIPIVSSNTQGTKFIEEPVEEDGEMELSESHTCVISQARDDSTVWKRVRFDQGDDGVDGGVVFELGSPPLPVVMFPAGDFLGWCFLCGKSLHGLDAFIYRGERAFCSAECRYQHITKEAREKIVSGVMKPFSCSASPCSVPFLYAAGLAAA